MLEWTKHLLRDVMGIPPFVVLLVVGLVSYLLLNLAFRKPLFSAWGLAAPLILGTSLEAFDIWTHYRVAGLLAPGNDPVVVILGRHAVDIFTLCLVPMVVVIWHALSSR